MAFRPDGFRARLLRWFTNRLPANWSLRRTLDEYLRQLAMIPTSVPVDIQVPIVVPGGLSERELYMAREIGRRVGREVLADVIPSGGSTKVRVPRPDGTVTYTVRRQEPSPDDFAAELTRRHRRHRRLDAARALARLRDAAPEAFADAEEVVSFVPRMDDL